MTVVNYGIFIKLLTKAMPLDATSKARIYKLYRIAVEHACDLEATVAPFTYFSTNVLPWAWDEQAV